MSVSVLDALRYFKRPFWLAVIAIAGFLVGTWVNARFLPDTAPVQPIEFSHAVHVGENDMECLYCHAWADRSTSAGVPSVSKCMGCHTYVATDSPEIQKVAAIWESREPIPWVKVHDVPDFVHFTHKRHVAAGLACQECHGPIETMARVERVSTLGMQWCVGCHTERQVEHGRDCWTCHK